MTAADILLVFFPNPPYSMTEDTQRAVVLAMKRYAKVKCKEQRKIISEMLPSELVENVDYVKTVTDKTNIQYAEPPKFD